VLLFGAGLVTLTASLTMPGERPQQWWAVLPVLLVASIVSQRLATTTGMHRAGREVLVVPIGQYLFAAGILLDPWWIAVLALGIPSLRSGLRGLGVRCQRIITITAGSATFWTIAGNGHPRIDGDESWRVVGALLAAMVVHTMVESVVVTWSVRHIAGTQARGTNIWSAYNAVRDLWEVAIGAASCVLVLVHPLYAVLMLPIAYLAVEHIRLERENRQTKVDARTNLLNVRGFEELAAREFADAAERHSTMTLLVLDLDHLRQLNNDHGHRTGDAVIAEVGRRLAAAARRDDVVARIGGEEFVDLLPDADLDVGLMVGERMRALIAETPVDTPVGRLTVSVSVGVAEWSRDETFEALFDRADHAMYEAKAAGRNRVCRAP